MIGEVEVDVGQHLHSEERRRNVYQYHTTNKQIKPTLKFAN